MTKTLCSFQVSRLLKTAGFNDSVREHYRLTGELSDLTDAWGHWNNSVNFISCPTQQIAIEWLIETHNLFIKIELEKLGWYWQIFYINKNHRYYHPKPATEKHGDYKSYESAIEAALEYGLYFLVINDSNE